MCVEAYEKVERLGHAFFLLQMKRMQTFDISLGSALLIVNVEVTRSTYYSIQQVKITLSTNGQASLPPVFGIRYSKHSYDSRSRRIRLCYIFFYSPAHMH